MKIDAAFQRLLAGRDLKTAEAQDIFSQLFEEKIPKAKAKTLLLLLARKGESPAEVLGCLKALRRAEPPAKTSGAFLDTCGTGGDGSHSINVSTLAAIVIAGAGGKVAKHGNRGLSSRCGSSDLLETLGMKLEQPIAKILKSIQKSGIGYLHAPHHHPVFSKMQGLRRELKTRTLFNLMGPLINPLAPQFQLVGVSNSKIFDLYTAIFQQLPVTALICQSLDGLDEISLSAPTKIAIIEKGKVRLGWIKPERYGFKKSSKLAVKGSHPQGNAKTAEKILTGKLKGPARDIVILNAAAGLLISNNAVSLEEGIQKAVSSLDSGRAYQALCGLVQNSK